jgi:hypothetical protein
MEYSIKWHGTSNVLTSSRNRTAALATHNRPTAAAGSAALHAKFAHVRVAMAALRVFYAFDPTRSAILIIGGDKTGDNRFYDYANVEEIRTGGLVA